MRLLWQSHGDSEGAAAIAGMEDAGGEADLQDNERSTFGRALHACRMILADCCADYITTVHVSTEHRLLGHSFCTHCWKNTQ